VGTHFASPTWKMDDGSVVVGEVIARADAPEPGAIQWLLLRAKALRGSGPLSAVLSSAGLKPGASSAEDELRREPPLGTSPDALFVNLSVLWRDEG
jgi:Protein of unknown function (DUF3455)